MEEPILFIVLFKLLVLSKSGYEYHTKYFKNKKLTAVEYSEQLPFK
jgi:hypothetical protein